MKELLSRLFSNGKVKRMTPQDKSRATFERRAKEQFVRLKKIGLGISVMSL